MFSLPYKFSTIRILHVHQITTMATFYLLLILITFFFFSFPSHIIARNTPFHQEDGFTLSLIHRDSPLSPLYDPSRTRLDVISDAFSRSVSRVSSMKMMTSSSSADIQAQLYSVPGEYIMEISIGTPPFKTLAIADTGSDLTWIQCSPCTNCYKQTTPIFNPKHSNSYTILSCNSTQCSSLDSSSCKEMNQCVYTMSYGDHSQSEGDLSLDTFTFDSSSSGAQSVSIENVAFGCGHDNSGAFNETISGIVGLGGGPLSIVNQLKETVNGKFSYCMVPIFSDVNVTSYINFGSHATVAGPGSVSTPLVKKTPDTYYYLTLEAIKVANKRLSYKTYTNSKKGDDVDEGNIIIDSGTTLTMLPRDFYEDLEKELKEVIGAESTADSQGQFGLCYKDMPDLKYPTITLSFTGADLDLPASNTFLEMEVGLVCLTMIPSDSLAIFGNLSQENMLVGYDLVKNQVSFKSADCSKQ